MLTSLLLVLTFTGFFSQATLFQPSTETIFGSTYDFTTCESNAVSCLKGLKDTAASQCEADNIIGIICQSMPHEAKESYNVFGM